MQMNTMKVMVTGAASGMGRHFCLRLAEAGAMVAAADVNEEGLASLVIEGGGRIKAYTLNVADEDNVKSVFAAAATDLGGLNGLINNAGISSVTAVDDENYENYWDDTLNVVLTGQIRLIRAALPHLLKSDNGRIVNISSTEGFGASPFHSPYTAAKHGVIGLTRSLALELGPKGVTVNCICPGPINTNMTSAIDDKDKAIYARRRVGLKRYGEPEEVAHATLNLCLPSSSYINGVYLPVDGGLSIRRA